MSDVSCNCLFLVANSNSGKYFQSMSHSHTEILWHPPFICSLGSRIWYSSGYKAKVTNLTWQSYGYNAVPDKYAIWKWLSHSSSRSSLATRGLPALLEMLWEGWKMTAVWSGAESVTFSSNQDQSHIFMKWAPSEDSPCHEFYDELREPSLSRHDRRWMSDSYVSEYSDRSTLKIFLILLLKLQRNGPAWYYVLMWCNLNDISWQNIASTRKTENFYTLHFNFYSQKRCQTVAGVSSKLLLSHT